MQLYIDDHSLPVFNALASPVRLKIIQLLSDQQLNLKELSEALQISSPIVKKHVEKLEIAGIIRTEKVPGKSGIQRLSILKVDHIEINFPKKIQQSYLIYETSVPIGHYTNFSVQPSCGLASDKDFIGPVDQSKYFLAPERVTAGILWFTQGYIEYKLPNYLEADDQLKQIDISFEISSEFPFSNSVWPSDITFSLNNIELGTWQSPGDFADTRGSLTPEWWPNNINQYGLLKTLRITTHGTYMDGDKLSNVTIDDMDANTDGWTIRIEVKKDAEHVGGVTLFGDKFGNHKQDIVFKSYYI
ncbi:Predicted transcriptional regulator [Amphibacillus marinus]|uniref:Predicted transcriptional regulator n=1 Tax=Amphibacillus marinus TaxID=872970 RepID=A0A1H8MHP7_9BACI|nr:ArsR family transcriptional regulator [Amphibacillus marinus]SEO16686.1 Predicted transcriptional regulator [Amphibacillus marinus]